MWVYVWTKKNAVVLRVCGLCFSGFPAYPTTSWTGYFYLLQAKVSFGMLLISQASSQRLCNHSTFPALSSSCSHSFTHFGLISLYGGLSPSYSGGFLSLDCKILQSNGLPFCTSVIEYLKCESGYFTSHFYNFPLFFLSSFFSLDMFSSSSI